MNLSYTEEQNPLVQGIRIIGVGKHGSKPLPPDLLEEIYHYIKRNENIVPIQLGAFYGALMAKGPTEQEQKLLDINGRNSTLNTEELYDYLCPDAPANMRETGIKLLNKKTLSLEESKKLGQFLFSDLPGEAFRGMAANMLRIRYETEEEYHGLLQAIEETYTQGFQETAMAPKRLIQLAEPFDGVEHSYMITPLLAQALQKEGFPVVVKMGRSSGPKLSLNTLDLYEGLESPFLRSNEELQSKLPRFGWALDQKILSPALDEWVNRRRLIFKRPFLATLEKVLNPCKAEILITSVFHITYMEKMVTLAGMAGFSGVIVLKRGLEGSLAPSLAKASGILCAARQADGSFISQNFHADEEDLSTFRAETDDAVEPLKLEDNLRLIQQFSDKGSTGNADFDKRVKLAISLYQKGLNWISENTGTRP